MKKPTRSSHENFNTPTGAWLPQLEDILPGPRTFLSSQPDRSKGLGTSRKAGDITAKLEPEGKGKG
jgi:hypothetical protein